MIKSYLRYLLRAGNRHAVHSPFVFDLYTLVIDIRDAHPDYIGLKSLRKSLSASRQTIEVLDLGAGSRTGKSRIRSLGAIARNVEKPEKFGKLFHRLVRYFKPAVVLELGTSLGLTTLYFSKAAPDARIFTLEGCPQTAEVASANFIDQKADNIEVVVGNIDKTLATTLERLDGAALDMVFFDANHRYEPTMRYFRQCLAHAHENSVFILDDIYWSEEMTRAWEEIKADPAVCVTLDLFWIGIIFFRKSQARENFTLRF